MIDAKLRKLDGNCRLISVHDLMCLVKASTRSLVPVGLCFGSGSSTKRKGTGQTEIRESGNPKDSLLASLNVLGRIKTKAARAARCYRLWNVDPCPHTLGSIQYWSGPSSHASTQKHRQSAAPPFVRRGVSLEASKTILCQWNMVWLLSLKLNMLITSGLWSPEGPIMRPAVFKRQDALSHVEQSATCLHQSHCYMMPRKGGITACFPDQTVCNDP